MIGLLTLVKMQFKAKADLSFFKDRIKTLFKLLYALIAFAVITVTVYFIFSMSVSLHLLTITGRLNIKVLVFVFTIMQTISILSNTILIMKSLYFSGDNQILLTLPVQQNAVYFSKLIVYYFFELKKNVLYTLPVFVAFGIVNEYSLSYYPIVLFSFIFISMLPVALGALLSIPSCFIAMFLRDRKPLQILLAGAIGGSITYLFFYLTNLIPENLDLIGQFGSIYWEVQAFLDGFMIAINPFSHLGRMVVNSGLSSFLTFVLLLLAITALMVVAFFIVRPLYFKMVSMPYEHKSQRLIIKRRNKRHTKFISALRKEFLLIVRSPYSFLQSFVSIFILPFAIFLLNKCFSAMNTRLIGDYMALGFNVLMMLLILLNSSIACASLLSSEGKTVYIVKTKPESLISTLSAKIFVYMVASTVSVFLSVYIIYFTNRMQAIDFVLLFLTACCLNFAQIFWSVQNDITNPQYNNYTDGVHMGTNPNETRSTIVAFVTSVVFFVITLFLLIEDASQALYRVFFVALAYLIARIYLLVSYAKVYFREM